MVKILIAVADVDALVAKNTPIDRHAASNTASVYVAGHVYPMLPERLSTDLTRLAGLRPAQLVIEYAVKPDGTLVTRMWAARWCRNRAKLAYNAVARGSTARGRYPTRPRA